MKSFFRFIFASLLIAGIGIFAVGMAMHFLTIGTSTAFYVFFNDNIYGWIIMFGSIVVGAIGLKIIGSFDEYDYEASDYDEDYGSYGSLHSHDEDYADGDYDDGNSDSEERFVISFPYEYDRVTGYTRSNYANNGNWTDSIGNEYEQKTDIWGSVYYEKIEEEEDDD